MEELPHPDHVHVLEVLPPEEGETEGKRVEVAPSIGRFLLEHQVKHNIVCSLRGKSGMDEEEEQEDEWAYNSGYFSLYLRLLGGVRCWGTHAREGTE